MLNKRRNILERSTRRVKTHITAVLVGGLMLTGVSAQALMPSQNTVDVRIDLRDLATERGVANVYKQMTRRAKTVCAVSSQRILTDKRAAKTCATDILAEFVTELDDERITAYHKKTVAA